MDRKQNIQAALKKAFCLSPRLTVAIAIPSFVFVFVMLGVDATPPHTPLFYLACLLSSYALVITITGAPGRGAQYAAFPCRPSVATSHPTASLGRTLFG